MDDANRSDLRQLRRPLTSDFRVQRFTNPDELQFVALGEEPPATGWAIVDPGDVYLDGVHVGHYACWRIDQIDHRTPFWQLEYRSLESPPD